MFVRDSDLQSVFYCFRTHVNVSHWPHQKVDHIPSTNLVGSGDKFNPEETGVSLLIAHGPWEAARKYIIKVSDHWWRWFAFVIYRAKEKTDYEETHRLISEWGKNAAVVRGPVYNLSFNLYWIFRVSLWNYDPCTRAHIIGGPTVKRIEYFYRKSKCNISLSVKLSLGFVW